MDIAQRPSTLTKGQWGRLLILSGSYQLAGATVLNAFGAVRTGLDVVVVAAPGRAANAVLGHLPEVVSLPMTGRHFVRSHAKLLDRFRSYPVAVGSGMTAQSDVQKFLRVIFKNFTGPFVVDADALRIAAADKKPAKLWSGKKVVLTPNRQEYAVMTGDQQAHPAVTIKAVAKKWEAVVMCKGPVTVISDGKSVVEMPSGSKFLAKAGSGDVLTGVVGALLARDLEPFDAAQVAQAILRDASLRAEESVGPGMLASDVAAHIDLRHLKKSR